MARRRRKQVSSDESSDSDSDDSSVDLSSSSDDSSSADSLSESDSDSESDSSDSGSESEGESDFDDSVFPNENKRKTEEEVRELIRDAKVMKYETAVIDQAGIDNYEAMRNCDEKALKRLGMGYSDRERLLKAFRQHIEGVIEKNRERWERKQELKRGSKSKSKSKGSKSKKSKSKKSPKKKSSSKKSSSKEDSKRSKSKSSRSKSSKSSSKNKSSKSKSKPKIDPDEALRKLDTSWSGKKQAWADYKQHEMRVAELVEFYDEIGKKRTNAEEHARKLLCSYPGGINKLVIALDKKYHHIPYGWEELLEEALRLQEYEKSSE